MKRLIPALFLTLMTPLPALSNGVSMTNNPVSNSSGSVTNLGVMNMPSKQFTNTFALQSIQCQGDTLVIQPFITSNVSFAQPYDDVYLDPIYDERDHTGLITLDDDGNEVDGPDGAPDNPGAILGYKTIRTNQKANYAISPGISMSFNINMDRASVRRCREGAKKIVELLSLKLNDQRLSLEMNRLAKCGELKTKGYIFAPGSRYESLCKDVMVVSPPNTLIDHNHSIPTTSSSKNATSNQQPSSLSESSSSQNEK